MMKLTRRSLLAGAAAVAGTASSLRAAAPPARPRGKTFTPEMFGAKGNGIANDSLAMQAMADAVSAAGGGVVEFRKRTYIVGQQNVDPAEDPLYRFEPVRLLEFKGCTRPLVIRGNGARIKCADGLRFGTFTPDGKPDVHPMPYLGHGLGTPYRAMLLIAECTGPVEIWDLELDGNLPKLLIGGPRGDTGWQIPANGLALYNNAGDEIVRNINTHHHAQDGFYIDGRDAPSTVTRTISKLRSEYNARQACSIVGGRNYKFDNCAFNHTGRSVIFSNPGAGIDIEAEGGKVNRDLSFTDCEISNNFGPGLVADTGDSEGAEFTRCTLIGATNWSAWPNKPRFRFNRCTFVGALVQAHGDADPARAAQFHDCVMSDDPALSPTGKVYGGENRDRPMADLSDAANLLFNRCSFQALHEGVLPWSTGAIYADCRMEQRLAKESYPRGEYRGSTIINGNAVLTGSRITGEVLLNGRRLAQTRV
jgi:hypothetical protein